MELTDDKGVMLESFGDHALRVAVLEAFPDLRAELDEDDGSHLVISALARRVMDSLRSGNDTRARGIVAFVDRLLARADLHPEISNAIALSFVEPESLQASTSGRQLWSDMPKRVRDLVAGLENAE